MDNGRTQYLIDAHDMIIRVNDAWTEFAADNGAPELTGDQALDRPLWDFVYGRETRHLYRLMLSVARSSMKVMRLPFRCDSPELKRFMEMEMVPTEGGLVEFRCETLRTEKRSAVALLDPEADRSNEHCTICSWCKRVRLASGQWVEIEVAVRELDLMGTRRPPKLTHGICPEDHALVMAEIRKASGRKKKTA